MCGFGGLSVLEMEFKLEDFVAQPSLDLLGRCTKAQLCAIADHYDISVSKQAKTQLLKSELASALSDSGILPPVPSPGTLAAQPVSEEVRLKELEVEMRRLELRERELVYEKEIKEKQLLFDLEARKMEFDLKKAGLTASSPAMAGGDFDLSKCIRLVPPFNEKDVGRYFVMFERVAGTLKWPRGVWTLLLQSVLTGKAQDAYAAMSPEWCSDYDKVKSAVPMVTDGVIRGVCMILRQ